MITHEIAFRCDGPDDGAPIIGCLGVTEPAYNCTDTEAWRRVGSRAKWRKVSVPSLSPAQSPANMTRHYCPMCWPDIKTRMASKAAEP